MKSFNVFVLFFVLTAVLSFFGACSKKDVSNGSNAAEVNDLKTELEDLRNQVQRLEGARPIGGEVTAPGREPKTKFQNGLSKKQDERGRRVNKLSPFTKVSCVGDKALETYSGKEYELMGIDDLSTKQILEFCKKSYSGIWEKRFAEDLVEVMSRMGKEPGVSVKLTLKDLATDKLITVDEAPMTECNRQAVWKARL